jgi:DNA gyrase subunit B
MAPKPQKYDESNIQAHVGLDGLRKRPSMYIGELGNHAVFHLIKEGFDNVVDEMFAGRNTLGEVVSCGNIFVVRDESGGIPVGINKQLGISTLTTVFTHLHAGGKFDNSAFKVSAGTHGVGNKAITALSTRLEVWTFRDGTWHYQKFSKGKEVTKVLKQKPSAEVLKLLPTKPKKGTILLWEPDLDIIGKTAKLIQSNLTDYLKGLAYLNKGFKINYRNIDAKKGTTDETYYNNIGPAYYITNTLTKEKLTADGKPIIVESEFFDCAVQLCDYEESEGIKGYVNSSLTVDGGKHLEGFWSAFVKALAPYANRKHSYTARDIKFGLLGYINLRISGPKFSSQTKEKLVGFAIDGKNVTKGQLSDDLQLELEKPDVAIERYVSPWLVDAFKKNKSFPKAVLDRATQIAKAREQSRELMKAASKLKVKDKHDPLPGILYTATKAGPEARELFIVEGDSAAGCFLIDTPVMQADGSTLTFGEMVERHERGEKMFSVSWDTEKQVSVVGEFDEPRLTKYVNELIEVELSDGSKFVCTTDHPWLSADGSTYIAAEDLQPGLQLKDLNP